MPSLSRGMYDLVTDDGYDSRVPLYTDQAFEQGITFQAKYIGTLDIPRPNSKVEIVAAMRRIRYEFKAKCIKKKKVTLLISTDGGLRVMLRKTRRQKRQRNWDDCRLLLMQHPIHRIFYVSHDSHDHKIWSYIAREVPSNVFKCNVFKAYRKNQATRIVRTLGQAFDVCNTFAIAPTPSPKHTDQRTDQCTDQHADQRTDYSSEEQEQRVSKKREGDGMEERENRTHDTSDGADKQHPSHHSLPLDLSPELLHSMQTNTESSPPSVPMAVSKGEEKEKEEEEKEEEKDQNILPRSLPAPYQLQLLQQQLQQQQHQTQAAIAQLHLLKDHLAAETAARIEAQARAHQLMLHNKDLLGHVTQLLSRLQVPQPPQDLTIPNFTRGYPPATPNNGHTPYLHTSGTRARHQNNTTSTADSQSPDSGLREMSSDSLAILAGHAAATGHHTPVERDHLTYPSLPITPGNNSVVIPMVQFATTPPTSLTCLSNVYPSRGNRTKGESGVVVKVSD